MRNTLSSLLLVLVTGCASWPPLQPPPADDATRPVVQETTPVVRTGRYTAVAQGASDAERDPLTQTVTLRFPAQVRTVRAAIEHALRGTGYRFADFDAGAASAPDLPLPDVQRELGPLPLAEALAVLAGESWQTRVNPVTRVVSMNLRPEFRRYLPLPAPEAVAAAPASPPAAPAVAAPAAAAPVQLAAAAPTLAPALVAASATDEKAKPVAVAVAAAAPPQPVAEQPGVTQPWRPGEQGGHVAVAEAAGSPASGRTEVRRTEVLEDGQPAEQRPKNPWLAGLRFATLHTDDTGSGEEGGGGSDRPDASHAEPQPAQLLAMAEPSPAAARAPRGADRHRRADHDRPDPDDVRTRTPVATLQPLVRLGPGTLSVVLDTWLRNAGWALVWRSGADFRIEVPFALDAGTPADPVRLMASLSDLYGIPHCAYPANRTIVVLQPGTNLREECR